MQSSSLASKPRRVDLSRRTNTSAGPKARTNGFQREDKNMNTITASSQRRVTKAPTAPSRTKPGIQPRAPTIQSRLSSQKPGSSISKSAKPKPKGACAVTANKSAAAAPPPLPNVLPLDPNCNEPSLPCLCCDGRSPQDNNSMFNHNHNNNNTISLKQQLQLPPPPAPLAQKHDGKGAKEQAPSQAQVQMERPAANLGGADKSADENVAVNLENKEKGKQNEEVSNIDTDSDEDFEEDDDDDDDDDDSEDDDTLVPSSCDCPPSFLDFSLSSSTSSSSTSISSCSDLESDCTNPCSSICSTEDQENLSLAYSLKDHSFTQAPESQPPARSPPSLPVSQNPFAFTSKVALCSPDEGYPSALDSPSPDYLGVKGDSESAKLDLLDFLESVGEFGKMERFSQVIQVARWDLEGEQHWDVLRHRLDHLDRLEKVNREVKLAYIARLHDKGYDLGDLEEQNLTDIMDEMGNIDVSWRLYKAPGGTMSESQEFSDAGVDLTALSDIDEPFLPDSLPPSPIEPPPRPPKPPARHESVNSDLHTYINISRETTSMAVTTSPTLSTFSPNSPTFTTFRCEKPLPPSPPSIPPLPASKPVPYLSLYTTPSPPPSAPTPTPPIPPPRRRHLARKEAQRLAALQAEQEKTPLSLPPPTSRPPPLPPPPVISITSSPPIIPPPPTLPPPPSFHALDVEIRKLLMLAGLTQAELLKLSPELGVCIGGLEDEQEELQEFRLQDKDKQLEETRTRKADEESDAAEEARIKEENKEKHRTTTFTEMARRRKKTSDLYYQTPVSNIHETVSRNTNIKGYRYPAELADSPPPPPPPRPLPPIPPSLPPVKVSTLPANSKQPERFDWLIAFTPECEAPAHQTKSHADTPKKSSSSGSSPGSAPKVTTFKELRFRSKNTSPPTKLITEPDPDPTVITPDPDILYNLKWRKEKAGSDGSQWEYTSQAQALFMQPPPALTSMAALQEMLQRADKEGGQLELCPSPKIGFSVSDNNLLSTGRQWEKKEVKHEDKEGKEEGRKELEVRGRADGGRTIESRTSVSSPPLSLAQPSQPYFLHPSLPRFRPGFCNSQPLADPRPHSHVGKETRGASAASSPCIHRDDFSSVESSGFNCDSLADFGANRSEFTDDFKQNAHSAYRCNKTNRGDFVSDSFPDLDSLCCISPDAKSGIPVSSTTEASGCTTPYKNIDVMMTHSESVSAADSLYSERRAKVDQSSTRARTSKELPPLPTYYLHHPKNCPLHRGAPPRLSPIGALSPPQRCGAPPPGVAGSSLSSPLFPRSHTLPALAAPLYYPNLYPPIPPRAPPLPPKLYQAPPKSHAATVRSVSFGGSVQKAEALWMGEDVKYLLRGDLSSQCLQEKKALVSAVSVAVEAILAQFSSSRTVVQKTLSGDSTINPSLGRLVLQCLCPALHSLLIDGLKPHQSDLIAGRRPNSAWSLVNATTRPAPKTQALYNLQVRVSELPQLKQSKHRFNAFILGLLNIKHLDFWLSHLQSCSDVLETYYFPTSFMRLSVTACQPLFKELLLVLQPLSLLTFNVDLLFQHHHVEADGHRPQIPPGREDGFQPSAQSHSKTRGYRHMESLSGVDFGSPETKDTKSSSSADVENNESGTSAEASHTSPQLLWVQKKEIEDLPPPNIDEDSFTQQAGQVIQQGWGAMMRWGGKLSQNLADLSLSSVKKEEMNADLPDALAGGDYTPVSGGAQVPWGLGRLFGASKSPNSPTGHTAPTRRPSQWLAPGVTAFTRMVSSSSTPMLRRTPEPLEEREPTPEKDADTQERQDKPRPLRSVRALCDHTGNGSELSFCKGEELVVLGGVDQDWIRCRQGDREGLVPIGYTSLIM